MPSKYDSIIEGETKLQVSLGKITKSTKVLPVFYNPVMEFNRSTSIYALKAFKVVYNIKSIVALPLAGSGVRGVRFLNEAKSCVSMLRMNDLNPRAITLMKKNLALNKVAKTKFEISKLDANEFMEQNEGSHYLDIDPFGTPNPFLDAAVRNVRSPGILAVTATDTSALCGSYPAACRRKYWAKPNHGPSMHEFGLRILVRKVQLVAAQYDRAMIPLFSYSRDHYMRIMFLCKKGKKEVDKVLSQHEMVDNCGPFWTGLLQDSKFLVEMIKHSSDSDKSFLKMMLDENKVKTVGCSDLHVLAKSKKKSVPRTDLVLSSLRKKGFRAERAHSNMTAIKTNASEKEIKKLIK